MQGRTALIVASLALAGCTASATPSPSPVVAPGSTVASATPSASAVAALRVGDCTGDVDLSGASIAGVPTVPCSDSHSWEVHAVIPVTGDAYPGEAVLSDQAKSECAASFLAYVGVEAKYSRYSSAYLTADEGAWVVPENRVITCLAGSDDGGLVGSARGDTLIFPEKGQCTGPQDVAAQAVKIIDCAAKHYYEVFATKEVTGKTAPTAAGEQKLYTSVCQAGFKDFVGVDVGRSKYEIAYFLAGADTWDKVADHRIVCSAGSPKGGIKGSLEGVKE